MAVWHAQEVFFFVTKVRKQDASEKGFSATDIGSANLARMKTLTYANQEASFPRYHSYITKAFERGDVG